MTRAIPLTIRGVTYPSRVAAARALGVTKNTVGAAVRAGTLERCGLGKPGSAPCPVRVRGVVYADVYAAAAALGVTYKSVYSAIDRGTEDRLGLPRGRQGNHNVPCKIGPLAFASRRLASSALGFKGDYVSQALTGRSPTAKQRVLAAAMALHARRERASHKRDGAL